MDYNSQTCDSNKIYDTERDDFSILWNEQIQSHSKIMDTDLDDIEMNDELLDKLVTALLRENTLDLYINKGDSNLPAHEHSCNEETLEVNSISGVMDNTLQIWQKLIEGDNTVTEVSHDKSNSNQAAYPPKRVTKSPSEEILRRNLIETRFSRANIQQHINRLPSANTRNFVGVSASSVSSLTKQITVPSINSTSNLLSSSTNSAGSIAKSCSASMASQADTTRHSLSITPKCSRYYLRTRSSAGSQSETKLCSSKSKSTLKIQPNVPTCSNSTSGHEYLTRSRTSSSKAKTKITGDGCCSKLAIVLQRARMSMIARLRKRHSRISVPTPKKRLQPRRLRIRKTETSSKRKKSHHTKCMR